MIGGTATALGDALSAAEADERQRALRALLRRPLLTARGRDADSFALVRRHAAWLRDWLARETGWQLHVDPEFARLRKSPADLDDATRPATDPRTGQPFTRRRYVLVCLALAALERADRQITLGRLAQQVLAGAADPELAAAGIAFDLEGREQRSDLVAVVRLLLDARLLSRVAGEERVFVDRTGDALYDVDRRVLAVVLVTRRGPSTVAATDHTQRLRAVCAELVADTDAARTQAARHALARRLLDDPIVYDTDLSDDERAYLLRQRPQLARRLADATGLVPELRAEGTAMLDPVAEATDLSMPEEGTTGHATLLLAEELAARIGHRVPMAQLEARTAELVAVHGPHWRKTVREPGAHRELCRVAVRRLAALRLVDLDPGGVRPRPALARYALAEPREVSP